MGSGGGGTSTQYVKSEQSNLPAYAQPYFENLMQRSSGLLTQQYTPYEQERIAGFTPQQQQVQQDILGQQTPGQFGTAANLATAAGLGSLQAGQYQPGRFRAQQVGQPNLQQFQMQAPDQFGGLQAQQYMSPYAQNVTDIQKREAVRDAQKGQLVQDLGAARQGTYGGSRQLLAGLERERMLGQQLGDIQQRGSQSAYENAQAQFERDRAAGMNVGQANLQAALGTQQLGTQTGLQALLANQQYGLEAQRLGEQSRQFASQQGLAGLAQAGQMGQTLGNLGQMQSQTDLARLNQQQQVAAQNQELQQRYLDTAYQDFMRQRDYPLEMLQQYSSMLRGVPVTPNSTQTTYAPSPSLASQIMGTGLGALGMYKSLAG